MYSHIHNVRHIEANFPTFGFISADLDIFRILVQLDIFMYIKAYSEPTAYSGLSRTVDIINQFHTRFSGSQEQFMHILKLD